MGWISKTRNILFGVGLAGIYSARGQATPEERAGYIIAVVLIFIALALSFVKDKKPIPKKQKKIDW